MVNNSPEESSNRSGYALFIVLIIISIILIVGFAVSRVSFQELRLSTAAQESQRALSAANSGVECAAFWDRRKESAFTGLSPDNIECFGPPGNDVNATSTSQGNIYTFQVSFEDESCAIVEVDKTEADQNKTTIISRGYNTICPDGSLNPRRVERAVQVDYVFEAGAGITMADISLVLDISNSMNRHPGDAIFSVQCNSNQFDCSDHSGQHSPVSHCPDPYDPPPEGDGSGFWYCEQLYPDGWEEGWPVSRLGFMIDGVIDFIEAIGDEGLGDAGILIGISTFESHSWIETELTDNKEDLINIVNGLTAPGRTSIDGGLFLGTDVIVGNEDQLTQNNDDPFDQSVDGGRDLPKGHKFIIMVGDGRPRSCAIEDGVERGKWDGATWDTCSTAIGSDPPGRAIYAAGKAEEEDIIIITFAVGVEIEDGINWGEWIGDNIASNSGHWGGCEDIGSDPNGDECHYEVSDFTDFAEVFDPNAIFQASTINWSPI